MNKAAAVIQIIIVCSLIIYGTVSLFLGHFEGAMATFPFLLIYYVYVVGRQRRRKRFDDAEGDKEQH